MKQKTHKKKQKTKGWQLGKIAILVIGGVITKIAALPLR